MIDKEHFLPLEYFKKTSYLGSISGLRFSIGKYVPEDSEEKFLRVEYWEGPFAKHKTPADKISCENFPFSGEGIDLAADYINNLYLSDKEKWDRVQFWTPSMCKEYAKKMEEEYKEKLS